MEVKKKSLKTTSLQLDCNQAKLNYEAFRIQLLHIRHFFFINAGLEILKQFSSGFCVANAITASS